MRRFDVMFNEFLLVGPVADPAGIAGMSHAAAALARIAEAQAPFVSRGDDSGTHKRELALWRAAGVDVATVSANWYQLAVGGV